MLRATVVQSIPVSSVRRCRGVERRSAAGGDKVQQSGRLAELLPFSRASLRFSADGVGVQAVDEVERTGVAWLGRKIGWGFAPGQLEEWTQLGAAGVIDRLVEPDDFDIEARVDPFADVDRDAERMARMAREGVTSWIRHAISSPRPLETFMEFFWSDYFAVSIRSVRPQWRMFDHMTLLSEHCLGNFAELLRAVTIDPAMLNFLDGASNSAESPNENYGRELLELYSVGVGNFTEDDVKAASRALTGWVVRRRDDGPRFIARRHDATPQTLLGVDGVQDVDTTIDAVLAHEATAEQVVAKLAAAILGPTYEQELVADLAATLRSDWEIKPVVRELLTRGAAGAATASIAGPLAWYASCRRIGTRAARPAQLFEFFRSAGQVPLMPPNVGGFPGADAYLSTAASLARFNFASHLAERSANNATLMRATEDVDSLAEVLGLARGFAVGTHDALEGLDPGVDRLAAALASPDMVVV